MTLRFPHKSPANRDDEIIIDLFAGGGGVSTGIEIALGRSPDYAINKSGPSLMMHDANDMETVHLQKNIVRRMVKSRLWLPGHPALLRHPPIANSQSALKSKETWRSNLDALTVSKGDPNGECRITASATIEPIEYSTGRANVH